MGTVAVLATVVLYAASHRWNASYYDPSGTFAVVGARGLVHVQWFNQTSGAAPQPVEGAWRFRRTGGRVLWLPRYHDAGTWRIASVPLWIPLAPMGVWVSWRAIVWGRRLRAGDCTACGYDLAGLFERAGWIVCPECGKRARCRHDRVAGARDAAPGRVVDSPDGLARAIPGAVQACAVATRPASGAGSPADRGPNAAAGG